MLPASLQSAPDRHVSLQQLPSGCEQLVWKLFHDALAPVVEVRVFSFCFGGGEGPGAQREGSRCVPHGPIGY